MRKHFGHICLLCLLCLLLPLHIAIEDASAARAQLESDQVIENDLAARILAASVHIRIEMLKDNRYVATAGLATAVAQRGHISLITHNHWNLDIHTIGHVTIRNASGALICRLHMPEFRQLIRYQSKSVMILDTNRDFKQDLITPVQITAPVLPEIGATVQLVRQHPDSHAGLIEPVRLVLNSAQVTAYSKREGLPVIEITIRKSGERLHLGDSGGGIWFNGQLIAQIWRILMFTRPAKLGASPEWEPPDHSRYGVAAQLPWHLNSWPNWLATFKFKETAALSPVKQPCAWDIGPDEPRQPHVFRE